MILEAKSFYRITFYYFYNKSEMPVFKTFHKYIELC
jgi:hypothetical protein